MRFLISGFGHAGKAYASAIEARFNQPEIYIKDINSSVIIPKGYIRVGDHGVDFYDVAIIATPPGAHLQALRSIIGCSKLVIVEKPIAIEQREYYQIMQLAAINANVYFSFHAFFGKELMLRNFVKEVCDSESVHFSHVFFDPYLGEDRSHLGGPFWDSIYNVVSIFHKLSQDSVSVESVVLGKDSFNVFEAKITYRLGVTLKVVTQDISIRWDMPVNLKVTQLNLDYAAYSINHSTQSVSDVSGLDHRCVDFESSRLEDHYGSVVEDALSERSIEKNSKISEVLSEIVWKIMGSRKRSDV